MKKLSSIFRLGRLKNSSGDTVQVEQLNGEVHSSLKHPQSFGVESLPPAGSETYSVYQDGNPDQGAVLIVAGRGPVTLAEGDTVVYNASGVKVHMNGSTIRIDGGKIELNGNANGGLIEIANLTTKINALVTAYNAHQHIPAGSTPTTPGTPLVRTDYENTDIEHG